MYPLQLMMIRNRSEILKKAAPEILKRRRILLNIADHVLRNIAPNKLFKTAIPSKFLKKFDKIVIFGIGKAAAEMTKAILPLLHRKPDKIFLADEGHPAPTMQSLKNTEKMIHAARDLKEKDLAVVLISGGGSSMFTYPAPGISLKHLVAATQELLKAGAAIQEINIVRKHLCQVKGGKFAALLYPATVLGFVISDVAGNDLSTIASGPIAPDKSTFEDALKILEKFKLKGVEKTKEYLLKSAGDKNAETIKPGSSYFKKIYIKILADHSTVAAKAEKKAKRLGLKTIMVKKPITGEARDAVKNLVSKTRPNSILIASGETTVTCRGKGHGGRNQEFVLSGLRCLKKNQTLLSLGTDGVDGVCPEEIAGAIGDFAVAAAAKKQNLSIEKFLRNNDSYTFFKKTSSRIKTGRTGTNLGDLMLLLTA